VVRYKNDHYYNRNEDGFSEEAEWCFGFPWLAIIHHQRGDDEAAGYWLDQAEETVTEAGVPELYYSNTDEPNKNNPLGWSESMLVVAKSLIK
jgi:phosphorylase kinase alpha/beta subunit